MNALEQAQADLEAVTAKNLELLAELKTAKGRNKELTDEVTAATDQATAATTRLENVNLITPVNEMLKSLFVLPPKYSRQELEGKYRFSLDDEGVIQLSNGEGKPVMIGKGKNERAAGFDRDDLTQAFRAAGDLKHILKAPDNSGGGAPGSGSSTGTTSKPKEEPKQDLGLGLR